jgi:hypothetical protein
VNEYKDLSLRELLEISDGYLFREEEKNLFGERNSA